MNDTTVRPADTPARASESVQVRIVYLARLRDALGTAGETLSVARDGATVAHLLERLRARGGAFGHELAPGRTFRVAVNHAMASADTALRDGDEVAVLPPVTGG